MAANEQDPVKKAAAEVLVRYSGQFYAVERTPQWSSQGNGSFTIILKNGFMAFHQETQIRGNDYFEGREITNRKSTFLTLCKPIYNRRFF